MYMYMYMYLYIYIHWYIYQDGMAWLLDPPEWMTAVHHLKFDELYSQTCENRVPSSTPCSVKTHFSYDFSKRGQTNLQY